MPPSAESGADAAWVAVVRTGVLALSGVVLSMAARSKRIFEAAWLVYPVLIAGGLKLMLEDIPAVRPRAIIDRPGHGRGGRASIKSVLHAWHGLPGIPGRRGV